MRVLGITGSLRRGSHNARLLGAAGELLPPPAELEPFDGLKTVPAYDEDDDGDRAPVAVRRLRKAIREADAILIATPEYNYSIPGVLKNAIDWASRPYGDSAWKGKPVAVMGASVGALGTARAQYDLRKCFVFLDLPVVNQPEVMISAAADKFDQDGNLTDAKAKELIGKLLASLCELAGRTGGFR